jgi:type IV pilus biogenesis protein PilP
MKPQFALDLSHTGIRLLHVAGGGETELGAVRLDDSAFETHVYDLYRLAEGRAKGRVRTQLLIPNSEVLYTRVHTGAGEREARGKAVAEALASMTPYDLDDLVFDWRAEGEDALVAAVARETLEEAEAFAKRHGFNPVSFSARPAEGSFRGTPDFGQTKLAEARRAGAPWPAPPAPPKPAPAAPPAAEETPPVTETPEATEQPVEAQADVRDVPAGELAEATPTPEAQDTSRKAEDAPAAAPDAEAPADAGEATAAPAASGTGTEATITPAAPAEPETQEEPAQPPLFTLDDVPDPAPEKAPEKIDLPEDTEGEATATPASDEAGDKDKAVAGATSPVPLPADPAPDRAADAAPAKAEPPAEEGKRKRGAGRATATPARKSKKAKTDKPAPEDKSAQDAVPPMPAFASRRAALQGQAPKRPSTLPPLSALPSAATPPPPRPKIPPHLAKSAPPASDARGSRLSSLMSRLQRIPDAGAPLDTPPPAAPEGKAPVPPAVSGPAAALGAGTGGALAAPPQPAAGKVTVPMPPKTAPVPKDDLPPPQKAKTAPKVTAIAGTVAPDSAHEASLTPPPRRKPGTSVDPGPRLPDRGQLNEAESMTLFGARQAEQRERGFAPVLIGIAVVLVLAIVVWTGVFLMGSDRASTTAGADAAAVGLGDPVAEALADPDGPGALPSIAPEGSLAPASVTSRPLARPVAAPPEGEAEAAGAEPATAAPEVELAALEPADTAPAAPLSDAPLLAAPGEGQAAPTLGAGIDESAAVAAPSGTAAPQPDGELGPQETAQPLPEPDSRDEAVSRYAALGIWQIPPDPPVLPEGGRIDDLRLAALDPSLGRAAAPALDTAPARIALVPPAAQLPPAPAGTEFDLDAEGQVVATPEGALSPQGVRVTAGPPGAVPPQRPARPASLREAVQINPAGVPDLRPRQRPASVEQQDSALAPTAAPATDLPQRAEAPADAEQPAGPDAPGEELAAEAAADEAETGESTVTPRVVVAEAADGARPLPRPETVARLDSDLQAPDAAALAAATGAEAAPLGSAAGLARVPSPPSRPAQLASLAAPNRTDATPPAEAAEEITALEAEAPLPESPYAVISSRKPASRPASLEREAEKIRQRSAAATPVAAAAAVRPTAPTKASVAKSATEANVLNLARMNLIGVYGGASDRRALIRLPSGRFVKVKVGDRIDGGRVASIGADEVRYVKGGRNITLEMPRG